MPILPEDPLQQKKILIGVVPLLLALAYGYLLHGDLRASVRTLDARLQRLEAQNEQALALRRDGSADLRRQVDRYEERLARVEQLIPKDEDVPALLHAITLCAQETGIELLRLVPEDAVAEDVDAEEPHYQLQTFYLDISGSYHDIARFLAAVGSLPRIVTPRDVRMAGADPAGPSATASGHLQLAAELRIQTYVLPDPVTPEET